MNSRFFIFLLLSSLWNTTLFAQDNIQFIENKGQWDPQVKFMAVVSAGSFFIHQDGFTILQHNVDDFGKLHDLKHAQTSKNSAGVLKLRSHAYRMSFVKGNNAPKIIADKSVFSYNNYFIGNDPSKWATGCKIYQGVTIKEIYPNVDVRYYSDRGSLKYDLIVNPGADLRDIALQYSGANNIEVRSKQLVVRTSVGDLKELEPYSYQYKEAGKEEVSVKYLVRENVMRFDVKGYDPKSTLVIDPQLVFSSFSGSSADNWGFTATYGPDGSMYGGGVVFNPGFPVSTGAFQTNFSGGSPCTGFPSGFDMGIIKLSPDGSQRIYATYLGGSDNEMPQSLIVDPQGQLIVAGRSSSSNFPVKGAGQVGPGGKFDITLTKFSSDGTALIGSLKIGGSEDDGANITPCGGGGPISLQQNYGDEARSEVMLDGSGNIYLASCTRSTNFPVTGGFQTSLGGGQDGLILKVNPGLSSVIFASYFGGTGNDAAYVLALHPITGDIYIAGGTESNNLPGSSTGTVGSSNHGTIDGFVSIISNTGASVIKTTYVGTTAIDQIYGIQFDANNFPYIMGQTRGTWPVVNATWSQTNGKQFIVKLQPDLSALVYSTVFGKGAASPDISPVAFLVDRCENVYISGWGGQLAVGYPDAGTDGLTVTPDAFKSSTDGGDFYFFVLQRNATAQLFGSFYGKNGGFSDHVDGGTSRFDRNGVIYQAVCADCKGSGGGPFPTTSGVWGPINPSPNCNLAMLKINMDLSGVHGVVQSTINGVVGDTAGCLPIRVKFSDIDPNRTATQYEWNFGDGTPQVTTSADTISHLYNIAGNFRVMMVAIDSSKCFPRDTSYLTIKVSDLIAKADFNITKLQPCESFRYQFDNLSTAPAARPFGNQSFVWDFGDGTPKITAGMNTVFHTYAAPGTYNVRLLLQDTAYCNTPDSAVKILRVASVVKANFDVPPAGCAPYNIKFNNTSQGGSSFIWNFGDGTTSNLSNPSHLYNTPGNYIISLTVVDSATCNITDSIKVSVTVNGKPTAAFTYSTPQINTPVTFTNGSGFDAVRFKWEFGDGDSLITTSRDPVQHEYNKTGRYTACLTAYNQYGCTDKVCQDLDITVETAVDVPNAFTPMSGDVNSKVFVKGYGLAKLRFTVWSRWGEKVFETEDKKIGWDGMFKGKLLPMDVYAYTLDVEFLDGTKTRKKGDITLIR